MANYCGFKGYCQFNRVGKICDGPDDCDSKFLVADIDEQPKTEMPLIESPQNPYPVEVFTFTIADYVKVVPDGHLRTCISGAIGRYVFNLCCEDWQQLLKVWLPAHDQQARREFAEKTSYTMPRILQHKKESWTSAEISAFKVGTLVQWESDKAHIKAAGGIE